jgi:ribonuclease HI
VSDALPGLGILCYGDGACTGNPGPGGWGAIVRTPDGRVRELGGGAESTTNNRMELEAAIHALYLVRGQHDVPVDLFTDSSYVIQGITQWVHGWRKRNWRKIDGTAVVNRDLWEKLAHLVEARPPAGAVKFHYVRGHTGVPGNERCDRIAVAYAAGNKPGLYNGPLLEYRVDLTPPDGDTSVPERSREKKAKPAGKASYLSYVDGRLERHDTWESCQRVVHGRSNAKFKKCLSEAEERTVLEGWGVDADALPERPR